MCIAEVATIPLDTAKVRLQIQGSSPKPGVVPYTSMVNCMARMMREEGPQSLWRGLSPGLLRQMVYGGLRLGMYDNVRDFYQKQLGGGTATFPVKVMSGFTTGALAMCAGQPADVIKVRFQAGGHAYRGLTDAAVKIVKADGVVGLWKGLIPNIARNAVINTAELATYDQVKESIKARNLMNEGIPLHIVGSLGAGFCAVCVGSPFDVVKTRIMNAPLRADGTLQYRGMGHAFVTIFRDEGPLAFYKGFVPNFMRLGSWVTVMFLSYEQIKRLSWEYIK
jgi:solute carrier family 25 uncoupling protein 8/9